MPAKEEEEFIPYLVLVRFDKGDAGSAARIAESLPPFLATLEEMGRVQRVEMSYDGSVVAFLVAAATRFEDTLQVMNHVRSPRSHKSSGLVGHDKVLVLEVHMGSASRLERVTGWLNEYGMLAE
jgi:hypothetical protein